MINQDVVRAWDVAHPFHLHPTRWAGEEVYRVAGAGVAATLASYLPAGCTVLDFGCGDGRISIPLADLGYDVIGMDSSPNHLGRLQDPRVTKILSDGMDLDLYEKVDAIVCLAVLIHYDYASATELLRKFSQVIRSKGTLILDLPTSAEPTDEGDWFRIATWDVQVRKDTLDRLGFIQIPADLTWTVWQMWT